MLYSYMLWLTPLWSLFPRLGALSIAVRSILKYSIIGFLPLSVLLSHTGLPTLAAVVAWEYASCYTSFFLLGFPLVSMATFIAGVGLTADAWFAAYWLALPILFLAPDVVRAHVVTRAVIASVTAHIVGTLIALVFGLPVAWAQLIPLVPFERLVNATGMIIVSLTLAVLRCAAQRMAVHYNSVI